MEHIDVRLKLNADELPANFVYPKSFDAYLISVPTFEDPLQENLEPWGITASKEQNCIYSEKLGFQLVKFAQAWHEDMISCFLVGAGDDPGVIVFNPWSLKNIGENKWEEVIEIIVELPNFSSWLEWVISSELVQGYIEARSLCNPENLAKSSTMRN